MNFAGVFLLATGLPCIGFGIWLRNAPPAEVKASKKKKHKTKTVKTSNASANSFIWGGLLFAAIGAFAIAKDYMG